MLLRCIASELTPEQRQQLGSAIRSEEVFHVTVGEEYVALGLEVWRGIVWVDIAENERTVTSTPLFLFQIVDGQLSSHWIARIEEDGTFRLWPEIFYQRAFHDRLSNGEAEIVRHFAELRRTMEAEAR